jgi:DNA-binding FrmR family transcriptional regulator
MKGGGGFLEYGDHIRMRLRRIEGQIRGVLRMMEEGKDCKDVVVQMSAIRSAVDRAIAVIVCDNLEDCLREEIAKGESGDTKRLVLEAVDLLVKSR